MGDNSNDKSIRMQIYDCFDESYVKNAGILIYSLAEEFFEKNKLQGQVYFNEDIFEDCLIDILVDIARLKEFHDIKHVNTIKLMAYTASWCLKRKPFQLIEGCDKKYLYVNEWFALSLLTQAIGLWDNGIQYVADNRASIVKNIKAVFYHLRYRNTNPQTLELMLVGVQTGQMVS